MDIHYRSYQPQDRESFLKFLANWIKNIPIEDHFNYLYQENPHGKAITVLALNKKTNEIVGCTSLFPRKIWFHNQVIAGCTGGDAYVDPQYRRRGIATKLHQMTIEEMEEKGIKFMHGFPNRPNLAVYLKMGSLYPGDFKQLRFLLDSEPFLKKLKLDKAIPSGIKKITNKIFKLYIKFKTYSFSKEDFKIVEISAFDTRFDDLIKDELQNFKICCIRDSEYLNWRYFKNPANAQQIYAIEEDGMLRGFVALQFAKGKCILFDFFAKNESKYVRYLIRSVIKLGGLNKSDIITILLNPTAIYASDFIKCGFKSGYFSTKNPLICLANKNDKEKNYMQKIENWFLTYGDTDYSEVIV